VHGLGNVKCKLEQAAKEGAARDIQNYFRGLATGGFLLFLSIAEQEV